MDISNQESWLSGSSQNLTTENLGKEYLKYYRFKNILDTYSGNEVEALKDRLEIIVKAIQRKISNLYVLKKLEEQTDYSIGQDTFIQATVGRELDLTMLR